MASYDVLQSAVDEGFGRGVAGAEEGTKRELRGEKLREWKRFLAESDPGENFGGLKKDLSDGKVVWTLGPKWRLGWSNEYKINFYINNRTEEAV